MIPSINYWEVNTGKQQFTIPDVGYYAKEMVAEVTKTIGAAKNNLDQAITVTYHDVVGRERILQEEADKAAQAIAKANAKANAEAIAQGGQS